MQLNGRAIHIESGLKTSLRAMNLQMAILDVVNNNAIGFDKIGYQRKEPVVSSFAEYVGAYALSKTTNDTVGRIAASQNPLDFALQNKGYFQVQTKDGIELTRDGRFKVSKDKELVTLRDEKVLSYSGSPIKLPFMPDEMKDVKVDRSGKISLYNQQTGKVEYVDTIAVVSSNNVSVSNPIVMQGYNEFSNVSLQDEFMRMMPIPKNFDANRQMFLIHSNNLSKVISEIGKV